MVVLIDKRFFFQDLPLKSTSERTSFFTDLTQKLFSLPEKVVSSQLAPLLLSRMVLLDETAAKYFLPNILTPAKGKILNKFSEESIKSSANNDGFIFFGFRLFC